MTAPLIALLTDFGTKDPFVGIMKAVIWGRCPEARIVDLTHEIPPQSIGEGAFWLERSAPWFAGETFFVVVVDPGVGTSRRGLVARAGGHTFIAPDNGLVTRIIERAAEAVVYEIEYCRIGLQVSSATFHGRDVFAPVAAELAAGRIDCGEVGPRLHALCPSPLHDAVVTEQGAEGSVVTIDRFGNAITNIEDGVMRALGVVTVFARGAPLSLVRTYADIPPGTCAALVNSFGLLEIARRDGSAATALGVHTGDRVLVRRLGSERP